MKKSIISVIEKFSSFFEKNSSLWAIPVVFLAVEYIFDLWHYKNLKPFDMSLFTDVLFEWHQRVLHWPIMLMVYMSFARRWSWRGLGIAAIITIILTDFSLIDLRLHNVLLGLDWYPNWMKMQNGDVNSNYAKIIVGVLVAIAFIVRFFQRGWRTMDRWLTLMMAISIFGTTLIFHWLWIGREYSQIRGREMVHMNVTLKLSESAFREVCKSSDWGCWVNMPSKTGNPMITQIMRNDMEKSTNMDMCTKSPCVFLSGGFDEVKNRFYPVPIGILKKDGVWRFMADYRYTQAQFLEIRQGLTTLGISSGTVWGFGLIILWAFHQKRFKKRNEKIRIEDER
jgi:hypothetical protein